MFRQTASNCGDVNDCILGAKVTGTQKTDTTTELLLMPDPAKASFEVVLSGETNSETFGAQSIAGVISSSNNRFQMIKPFSFDGRQFCTSTPSAVVWPNQTNQVAVPLRGNVPVLRRVIGAMAFREAERRKPAAQRITAYRVTNDASGTFNRRVDEALQRLQERWVNEVIPLAKKHLPNLDLPLARSTSTHAVFSLPSPWAQADSDPLDVAWVNRGSAVSFAVHQSALRAGIERLSIGGQEVGAGGYDEAIRQFAPGIVFGEKPTFSGRTGTLVLDEDEPAYVEFRDGRFVVVMNARIKTPVGELPAQRITMPWTFSADRDYVYVDPEKPTVEAADSESDGMMDVARPFIVQQLERELVQIRLPRTKTLPIGDGKSVTLRFQDLRCRDGWLLLGWEAVAP